MIPCRKRYRLNFHSFLILLFSLLLPLNTPGQNIIDGIAAIVGKEIILISEINQLTQLMVLSYKLNPDKDIEKIKVIKDQAMQSLIDQKILLEKAEEDSILVSDREIDYALDQQIESIIQRAGSEEKAEKLVGFSIKEMRKNYRDEIKNRLLVEKIKSEKFGNIKVSRREVLDFYKVYKDSLPVQKESVNISHILIKLKPGEKEYNKAIKKLKKILEDIKNGADFVEMAKRYSDDPGTRDRGGELGFVKRGSLLKEFEEVAFQLKPGEISDIVQTELGFHIIQLLERRGEKIRVRHILISPKISELDEKNVIKKLNKIKIEIDNGADFNEMALKYSEDPDVKINRGYLGWYEIENIGIKEFIPVIDTLKPGKVSKPFKSHLGYHIIKVNKRKNAGILTPDKNWKEIEYFALNKKQIEIYNKWMENLRKKYYIEIKSF